MCLAALLLTAALAGCGSTKKGEDKAPPGPAVDPNQKYTVVHWQHHSDARQKMVQQFAEAFMKEHSNITVQIESIPQADYWNKLVTTVASGQGPDVFQIPAGKAVEFIASGQVQPISQKVLAQDKVQKEFMASTLDPFSSQGKIYGLPTDVQTIILIYNKDLFKAAGLDPNVPPKNWDEVLSFAKKITKIGADGKMTVSGLGLGGYHPVVNTLMYQAGLKDTIDSKGNFAFAADAAALEAFKWYCDLTTVHKVYDPKFGSRWTGFRAGTVGMVFSHPAMMGNFKLTAPTVNWGVSEVPEYKGNRTNVVTSWGYVISKKANADVATMWMDYLTNEAAQKKWTAETGELPARTKLLDDADLTKDPNIKIAFESLKKAKPSRFTDPAYEPLIQKAWNMVLLEGKSPADALKWAEDQMNAEKKKKGM